MGMRMGNAIAWRALWVLVSLVWFCHSAWAKPPVKDQPVTLNFVNAEIETVARTVANLTQRRLVVDPRVKGTLTLNTERAVPASVAWDQLLSALRLQGYAVIETRGLFKLVPEAEAKLQGGADAVVPRLAAPNNVQVMTQIFKLNHESATQLMAVLRPLISPNNTINVTPGSNALVITDYADNLQRLARIIAALDVSGATDIDIIPLQHAVAADVVVLLQRLTEGSHNDSGFKTSIQAEPRSNAVILRSANPAKQAQVRSLIDKLDRPSSESPQGNLHVVYLKNADATKLATTLRATLTPGVPTSSVTSTGTTTAPANTGSMVQADVATNALIIQAPTPVFQQLKHVIDALDQRRAQVLVESLIVEVDASKEAQFGIQWQNLWGNAGGQIGVLGTNFGSTNNLLSISKGNGNTLPGPGLNFGLGRSINGSPVMTALANFLQSDGGSNILSKPSLLTLDNEEARIVVGKNVPFVTGQYTNNNSANGAVNPFQTVERKDVGLTLKVKPQISDSGTVKLTVFQEVSSIDSSKKTTDGLITNKRSIESNIVIADGEVVVLGGLLSDAYEDSNQQVPGLGDLPWIGRLFKSESRSRNKNNLMVFLRPVVVRDDASAQVLSHGRYKDMQQLQTDSAKPALPGLPVPNDLALPPLAP
ncbi:MAG: type II secretion system protein GspD [Betaproteobacteria bacterium]|nr:type II secretion system protein GspD [Betaproteobacteria bacterium]